MTQTEADKLQAFWNLLHYLLHHPELPPQLAQEMAEGCARLARDFDGLLAPLIRERDHLLIENHGLRKDKRVLRLQLLSAAARPEPSLHCLALAWTHADRRHGINRLPAEWGGKG